jgi:diguanylate cyclase (GGDEF)-like protein
VVTAQHEAAEKLQKRPRLDPATGALNRASLGEHINELLEGARRRSTETFVVLLAAIENLFTLNRTYGYDAADQIVEMVSRLRREMRGSDVIARYAGNKFGLVLAGCDAEQMQVAARRFIEAIAAAPFETDAGPVYASLRIGGVIAPRHGRSGTNPVPARRGSGRSRTAGRRAPLRGVRAFAQRIRCEVAGAPHG